MILVLFLLGTFILILFLCLVIMLSILKINIKNLQVQNILVPQITYDAEVEIGLYLFGKIPLLKKCINKAKLKKTKLGEKFKSLKISKDIKLNAETIKNIKILSPKIEYLELNIKLGTEDTIYTSFAIFIISTIISNILPHLVKENNYHNIRYELSPLYNGKNVFSLNLNSIIYVKMVHIINIIYIVLRKRRDEENERTSNRRAYAHSYE